MEIADLLTHALKHEHFKTAHTFTAVPAAYHVPHKKTLLNPFCTVKQHAFKDKNLMHN